MKPPASKPALTQAQTNLLDLYGFVADTATPSWLYVTRGPVASGELGNGGRWLPLNGNEKETLKSWITILRQPGYHGVATPTASRDAPLPEGQRG
jgi:hypothetical protein